MLVHCRLPEKYLGSIKGESVRVYYGGLTENGVVLNGHPVPGLLDAAGLPAVDTQANSSLPPNG
jgi:hypothetical protein